MLTRQDQLKLKAQKAEEKKSKAEEKKTKAEEKKAKAEEKKLAKQAAKEAKEAEKKAKAEAKKKAKAESKPKSKAKAKANSRKRPEPEPVDEPEEDEDQEEEPEEEACEEDEEVDEPEEIEVKPEKISKGKSKAKKEEVEDVGGEAAAARPAKKAKKVAEKDDKIQSKKPAVKSKAKPEVKGKAKAKAKAAKSKEAEDEVVSTPRKKLFNSESENEAGDGSPHLRKNAKGEVKPLKEHFENEVPERLRAARKSNDDEVPTGASAKVEGKKQSRAKAKAKGKGSKGKEELSPFAKKVSQKRKKDELTAMQESPKVDLQVQGIIIHHAKKVLTLTVDGLKEYLYGKVQKKFNKSYLNPYIMRGSCGIKVKLDGWSSASEIFHFSRPGTAKAFNGQVATSYVAASLMVSNLYWLVCGI